MYINILRRSTVCTDLELSRLVKKYYNRYYSKTLI
jgi:hypothetical protein